MEEGSGRKPAVTSVAGNGQSSILVMQTGLPLIILWVKCPLLGHANNENVFCNLAAHRSSLY
ncbi:hypothetical protein F2Q70_00001265 [Brassica cretica]|uniref:Uncharacterized protein n=2 Tax=Brassica cretica TaxID=69181 RepID=A0A3N6PN95_BRACR|nr:hypothetical protein F2Q68_00019415 [Brassica cretica]KAF2571480.1 hypothetical protein F2Q70_00001265 [Brassica cretica]KAF3501534.1 hypothetical protein F2Q69_00040782 [Brassica cretica]KAF3566447.1 hypothetical protein DY000_02012262 [Brassica cretica]